MRSLTITSSNAANIRLKSRGAGGCPGTGRAGGAGTVGDPPLLPWQDTHHRPEDLRKLVRSIEPTVGQGTRVDVALSWSRRAIEAAFKNYMLTIPYRETLGTYGAAARDKGVRGRIAARDARFGDAGAR